MRTLTLLTLLSSLLLAEQYIITYNLTTRDNIIINEDFLLSRAMTKVEDVKIIGVCDIFLDELDEGKAKHILSSKKNEILTCLFNFGIKLRSDGITKGFISHSTAKLSIPPTRVNVDFKDDSAIIELITNHF